MLRGDCAVKPRVLRECCAADARWLRGEIAVKSRVLLGGCAVKSRALRECCAADARWLRACCAAQASEQCEGTEQSGVATAPAPLIVFCSAAVIVPRRAAPSCAEPRRAEPALEPRRAEPALECCAAISRVLRGGCAV